MAGPSNAELLSLFYQAATSGVGLLVRANDPLKLRMKLYAARKEDPSLGAFQLRIDPDGSAVWIIPPVAPPEGVPDASST